MSSLDRHRRIKPMTARRYRALLGGMSAVMVVVMLDTLASAPDLVRDGFPAGLLAALLLIGAGLVGFMLWAMCQLGEVDAAHYMRIDRQLAADPGVRARVAGWVAEGSFQIRDLKAVGRALVALPPPASGVDAD